MTPSTAAIAGSTSAPQTAAAGAPAGSQPTAAAPSGALPIGSLPLPSLPAAPAAAAAAPEPDFNRSRFSSGDSEGGGAAATTATTEPPTSTLFTPPTQPHPWAQYSAPFAEAYARDLLNTRRNFPPPDAEIVALASSGGAAAVRAAAMAAVTKAAEASVVAAKGAVPAPPPSTATSTTAAAPAVDSLANRLQRSYLLQPAPAAGGTIAPAGSTSSSSSSSVSALPPGVNPSGEGDAVSAPRTLGRKNGRGPSIIKKWGTAKGLSVLASTFSAALPPEALKEVLAQAAAAQAAVASAHATSTSGGQHAPSATTASGAAHPTSTSGGAAHGSTWTSVDVGDMGLLDAVLYTLESSHAAARQAVATATATALATGSSSGRLGGGTALSSGDEARLAAAAAAGMGAITAVQMSCLAFRGHAPGAAITCLDHDPVDGRAVTGGNDGRLTLWDMQHRTYLHTYEDHAAAVTAVAIVGDVVVSASQDGTLRVSSFSRLNYNEFIHVGDMTMGAFGGVGMGSDDFSASSSASSSTHRKGGGGGGASSQPPAPPPSGRPRFPDESESYDDTDGDGDDRDHNGGAEGGMSGDDDAESDADTHHDVDEPSSFSSGTPAIAGDANTAAAASGGGGAPPPPSTPRKSFMSSIFSGGKSSSSAPPPGSARGASSSAPALSGGSSSTLGNVTAVVKPKKPRAAASTAPRAQHRFESVIKLTGHSGPITALDAWQRPEEVKPRTDWLGRPVKAATSSEDGGESSPPVRSFPCSSNYILASGGSDGTVRVWGAKWRVNKRGQPSGSGVHIATHSSLHKSGSAIECVKLSGDGRIAVSAARDGRIGVTDVATNKTWVMTMPVPVTGGRGLFGWGAKSGSEGTGGGFDPIIAPTGLPLVACSVDAGPRRPVTILSAGLDGTVRLWDLRTGTLSVGFPSGSPVWAYGLVPAHGGGAPMYAADGTPLAPASLLGDAYLVSGHEDGIVRKWDARMSAVPVAAWGGHHGAVTSLAVSPHSDRIVTGSVDGSVRLWDAVTGLSLGCEGHSGPVTPGSGTAMADDYMLSSSWDGTLRCWFPAT